MSLLVVHGSGCWSSADYPNRDGESSSGSGGTEGDAAGGTASSSTGAAGGVPDMMVPYDPQGPLGWVSVPGLDLDGTIGSYLRRVGLSRALSGNVAVQSDKTIIGSQRGCM